jgi:TolB-like protein/Tfp pilus assembly protein PilF
MMIAGGFVICAALVLALLNVAGVRDRIGGRSASVPVIRSIAVLPLDNLSGDPTQEYFADGMTESLISNLARIGALKVISRTSVMRYKDTAKSLPEIARELNVDAIVEGSVQRANDRVRITAQLIHAGSDTHLWAREYEGAFADALRLQGDVARAIASQVRIQVTPEEHAQLGPTRPVDPAAYEAFLRGRYHYWRLNEQDLKQAIAYFERAVQLAPNYAAAYAGLSQAWNERGVWGALSFVETERPQRAAAEKAVLLDDSLAEAHAAMAHVKYVRDWNWAEAELHFRRALALDPGSLETRHLYSVALMAMGRHDEAIAQIERAVELDPLSSSIRSTYGRVLYRARRYERAAAELQRAIELDERNFGAYGRLADVYEMTERYDDAFALNEKANALRGSSMAGRYSPALARLLVLAGRQSEAREIVERAKSEQGAGAAQAIAGFYAAIGDNDQAFAWLNRAIDQRQLVVFLKTEPKLEPLHADPRWPVLLRRINLQP